MINRKNTYFKSDIIKNLEFLKFYKNREITPVVYLKQKDYNCLYRVIGLVHCKNIVFM